MDVLMRCPCPDKDGETRHPDGDSVTLRDRLDYRTVTTIRKAMSIVDTDDPQVRLAERLAICTEFYMLMGVQSWSLQDERGKAIEVSHLAIRERIFEADDVDTVSEMAETLYNPVVLLPLVERASTSSPPRLTDDSTSQTSTPPKLLKPSKQSSITTSQTVATETITTSPDGASSSSQNRASAA